MDELCRSQILAVINVKGRKEIKKSFYLLVTIEGLSARMLHFLKNWSIIWICYSKVLWDNLSYGKAKISRS